MEPFNEKQEARNSNWIWILIPIGAAMLFASYLTEGDAIDQLLLWLPGLIVSITLVVCIRLLNLQTEINDRGISVKFSLFMSKPDLYLWEDISRAHINKYRPIAEYGGWGYRLGLFTKKRAYSISGNMGLALTLKNGQTVMIGTEKAEEMQAYLQYLKSAHQIAAIT